MLSQHKTSWLQLAAIALLTGFMAACTSGGEIGAGGDGAAVNDPNAPVDPDDPDAPAATVASLRILPSSTDLRSDADTAAEGVTLTAIVLDSSNNVIVGKTVLFSTDTGALQVTRATTDASGTAEAILTTGGDATNRTISVSATSDGVPDTVEVAVTGTNLSLSGPNSIGSGDSGTYTATLVNAGGEGIGNEAVTVTVPSGDDTTANTTASASSLTTNSDGQVTFQLTGVTGGTDTLSVSALGLTATQVVNVSTFALDIITPSTGARPTIGSAQRFEVNLIQNGTPLTPGAASGQVTFSATRGTIDTTCTPSMGGNACAFVTSSGAGSAGPATFTAAGPEGASESVDVEFVADNPSDINVQASPTSVPVNGTSQIRAIVRDDVGNLVSGQTVDFSLTDSTSGSLSAGSATTDSRGVAVVTYNAGGVSSGTDDVVVTATVRDTAVSNSANLTVGGTALRVSIGTGNDLLVPNETTFDKPFTVIVTDASGNPAPPNTVFRVRLRSVGFRTGFFEQVDTSAPPDGTPDIWAANITQTCPSEDVNQNGILDDVPFEDVNGSGQLEPFSVASVPAELTLDEQGSVQFNVNYLQNHNVWTQVELTATATVSGTESSNSTTFYLEALAEDINNLDVPPPGFNSPYNDSGGC